MKNYPRLKEHVWVGEGRWSDTREWYTLYSTCKETRSEALEAVAAHPSRDHLDKVRVKKFVRERLENPK